MPKNPPQVAQEQAITFLAHGPCQVPRAAEKIGKNKHTICRG